MVGGECYAQVLSTGVNTEIGQAQADVFKDKSIRVVSAFQAKIMLVVQIQIAVCFVFVIAVLLVLGLRDGWFQNSQGIYDLNSPQVDNLKGAILAALAILISSIPIALPLVLQVNLALGAGFMARKHHAIVTSLPALQDIASMSMLCRYVD